MTPLVAPSPEARAWLSQVTGIRLGDLALARMRGASSSTLYRVSDLRAPERAGFVLRLFTAERWLAEEPDLALHEAAALVEARGTGLPVPELIDYLPGPSAISGDDPAGFGAPAVLMTLLPGRVVLDPEDVTTWSRALAHALARVHELRAEAFPWRYRSWLLPGGVRVPAWADDRSVWEAAVEAYAGWRPAVADRTFLHRDFHPLNLLFEGSGSALTLSGVVDWVNACVGPAGADVAHCRINLVSLMGPPAAEGFLAQYREARGGFDYDPRWDLEALFDVAVPSGERAVPGYHEPWAEFGVAQPTLQAARERLEEHARLALAELG